MTKLRILAFSDLHGRYFKEARALVDEWKPEWIVLAGDMLPDFDMIGNRPGRLEAQREFWRLHGQAFSRPGCVTTFVRGNHELEGWEAPELRAVPAPLQGQVGFLEGIPAEFGAWGWSREWEAAALRAEVEAMGHPTIVVSHVPPYGVQDLTAGQEAIGHRALAARLGEPEGPALVLCGHVHESFGAATILGVEVVNVATGFALLTWDLESRQVEILAMERLAGRAARLRMQAEEEP